MNQLDHLGRASAPCARGLNGLGFAAVVLLISAVSIGCGDSPDDSVLVKAGPGVAVRLLAADDSHFYFSKSEDDRGGVYRGSLTGENHYALADGFTVWLNAQATLHGSQLFYNDGGHNREVHRIAASEHARDGGR